MSKKNLTIVTDEMRVEVAKQIMTLTKDTSLIHKVSNKLDMVDFISAAREEFNGDYKKVASREEVLTTSRFIANLDPSYRNGAGEYVALSYIRGNSGLPDDDILYVIGKFEEVLKPFISVSTETVISGLKLKVSTKMSKKSLMRAALMHLIKGTEVVNDREQYLRILGASTLAGNFKASFAILVGSASALKYNTVADMLYDLSLSYIDHSSTLERNGTMVFYDGAVRVEQL